MLDITLLRDDLEQVKKRMATRGTEIDWDEFLSLDRQRRDALTKLERLKEKKIDSLVKLARSNRVAVMRPS